MLKLILIINLFALTATAGEIDIGTVTTLKKGSVELINKLGVCSKEFQSAIASGDTEVGQVKQSDYQFLGATFSGISIDFINHIEQSQTNFKLYKSLQIITTKKPGEASETKCQLSE